LHVEIHPFLRLRDSGTASRHALHGGCRCRNCPVIDRTNLDRIGNFTDWSGRFSGA